MHWCVHFTSLSLRPREESAKAMACLSWAASGMNEANSILANVFGLQRALEDFIMRPVNGVSALESDNVLPRRELPPQIGRRLARENPLRVLDPFNLFVTRESSANFFFFLHYSSYNSQSACVGVTRKPDCISDTGTDLSAKIVGAPLHCRHTNGGMIKRIVSIALLCLAKLIRLPGILNVHDSDRLVLVFQRYLSRKGKARSFSPVQKRTKVPCREGLRTLSPGLTFGS